MRLKTKCIIAGSVTVGVLAAAGTVALVRFVRRQAKRVLKRKTRRVMSDILKMRGEDFVPGGELGMSLFRQRIDKLEYDQLVALFALVQVGYFIKASGINPMHPSKSQVEEAAKKYIMKEHSAPNTRAGLLEELDTSDAYDALSAAFSVLMAQ